jgi:K+-transporting ATPase ATPase C chain
MARDTLEAHRAATATVGAALPSAKIPIDLVTASASGLDPHISPAAARWQLPRVAKSRRMPPERLEALIEAHIEGRTFGMLGEPRVNVLMLNRALDALEKGG